MKPYQTVDGVDFIPGTQWYSYDNGFTWTRFPSIEQSHNPYGHHTLTVTKVDYVNKSITVTATKRDPRCRA